MAEFINTRNVEQPASVRSQGSDLEYPPWISDAGNGKYPPAGFMMFSFTTRGEWNSPPNFHSTVTLFMPDQFSAPINVMWGNKDTAFSMSSFAESSAIAKQQALRKLDVLSNSAAKLSQQTVGSSASADDINSFKSGQHMNPNFKVMFKGVDFRTFSFEFKFTPQNEAECRIVDNIIKAFRKAALPDNVSSGDAYISYPDELLVEYYWNGKKNEWLHNFKPAIITGMSVDYTSGGQFIAMRNGFPAETKLTLTMQETDILVRSDIDKGY